MTTMSCRLMSEPNGRRRGLTLIEIMSAILVLSIGLVGVLAAIPFGGFRLAQMNEADNSSLVGRDAVRLMKANGWANPENWFLVLKTGAVITSPTNPNSVRDDGTLNLTYPFIVDPLSDARVGNRYLPDYFPIGAQTFFTKVTPNLGSKPYGFYSSGYLDARFERVFYLPDDIASGYDVTEDDTQFRPFIETEDDVVLGVGETPAFTGRYSWMATVYPESNTEPFYSCTPSDINSANYDVVVFKDRSMNDERVMSVTVDGTGYQGGSVTLDLDAMLDNAGAQADDPISRARVLTQLETTKYIMLMGNEDIPVDGNYRKFARWYRIANYSVDDESNPRYIRASLVGPDTPTSWSGATVSGIFFPGVAGVYSGSTSF
ncbi:MAG: prepilin-type N-terminal cleavage/methylation domain-containing protein [Thermoguttaceae bacterium]|nr:prepilin-type N-terminal cleavage/methylation domain-containing protein [Thermoguttaceae bacterium]MBR5760227.1 prepilin-type N-terminal cleavage/methylation domain-containing protein [Thermoguttaceae bacterium]